MSAEILLYALVAAGLVFWLKAILGTQDDDDLDHKSIFSDQEEKKQDSPLSLNRNPKESNVVSLGALSGKNFVLPRHVRIDNKTAENALEDISKERDDFDLNHFVDGAEHAFAMIIEAFAEGDLETLKDLLAPPVYSAFEGAIKDREKRGETVTTEIQSIEKMDIVEALIKDDVFYITVRFTAREICVIRDKSGEIVSGDPDKVTQMVDIWVFSRDLQFEGPEWFLHETHDDEIEDHKTPVPESGKDKK